jgi:hypothetical protein
MCILGVVGISPGVSLMIGKMWGAGSGGGGYEKLMACMLDSANLGARIISLSVGVRTFTIRILAYNSHTK